MARPWSNKKGSIGEKRQLWIDTNGSTICPIHGYHNEWFDTIIKNSPALYCRKCMRDRETRRNTNNPVKVRLDYARDRAVKLKREFDLDIDFIKLLIEKQQNRCNLSGIPFDREGKFSFSIDRIDSSKGYTKDNVQLVSQYVNVMKNDMAQDLFISLCKNIAKHNE